MQLPREPREPQGNSPDSLIVYSAHKMGKSTLFAGLTTEFAPGSSIILSTELGGYKHLRATVEECLNYRKFEDTVKEITVINQEHPGTFKYVLIDSITKLDEWSEVRGTLNYMNTTQGKKFNRVKETGAIITPDDPNFMTVHELAQGYGYRHSRAVMTNLWDLMIGMGAIIVMAGHVKDKYSADTMGQQINLKQLDLTGKLSSIYPRRADAIAMFKREGKEGYLSFKRSKTDYDSGSRLPHLQDKIKISELQEDEKTVKTFWENIFID